MRSEQVLVVCAFGWGKEFRLYRETIYICNKPYRLATLTGVRLTTQQALGVPSARLDLRFGNELVTLRGIAAVDDAHRAVEYLETWSISGQRQQRSAITVGMPHGLAPELPNTSTDITLHEQVTRPVETPFALISRREPQTELHPGWKRERRTDHLPQEGQLMPLPVVAVPIRLADGEQAHYSSRATLCAEQINETLRSTYPAQDHGLLILTDRRLLYIGRKSQLVLEYAHLSQISQLQGALAIEADHWQKRAIFTMPQPEGCATRLTAILKIVSVRKVISATSEEHTALPTIPTIPTTHQGNRKDAAQRVETRIRVI